MQLAMIAGLALVAAVVLKFIWVVLFEPIEVAEEPAAVRERLARRGPSSPFRRFRLTGRPRKLADVSRI